MYSNCDNDKMSRKAALGKKITDRCNERSPNGYLPVYVAEHKSRIRYLIPLAC